jgi:hypothetical protein
MYAVSQVSHFHVTASSDQRASTQYRRRTQFTAISVTSVLVSSTISASSSFVSQLLSILLLPFFPLCPLDFQLAACFSVGEESFLSVCPIHFHLH